MRGGPDQSEEEEEEQRGERRSLSAFTGKRPKAKSKCPLTSEFGHKFFGGREQILIFLHPAIPGQNC